MFILKVFLIFEILGSANCANCSYTSWLYSFDTTGQSKCQENNYYIRGLERNNLDNGKDFLGFLEGVECCSASTLWSKSNLLVVYEDWTLVLDKVDTWGRCQSGYFLQGLYRTEWHDLHNIENGRCAKPASHPFNYGDCYVEDIGRCFNKKGRCSCKEGYYVTGLHRGNGDKLYNLDKLSCCSMSIRIQEITDAESFKTHIMDSTLWNMANLAHMLGYGWCLGNRGVNVGEDFERNGNTWQASTKLFYSDNNCYGEKCDQRLSLTFGDWSLAVKEVKYGQSVIDDLQPESIESGTIQNNDASPVTETFEISRTIQQTITHTSTSSWSNSHEAGLSINFNLPFGLGGLSASYKFRYETSSSTTDEQSTQNSKTFTKITSKTVQPFSGAKYNVILGKSRTTIPYTAVIIAKFSTEFIGFMRHGGGYGSKTTNYHYQYQGTKNTPTIKHRFGSTSVPFYTALRREVESQSRPWLWTEMFKNYPTARNVINSLTDEAQYEFTLHGTLAQVAGTKIDVNWETVNITQQDKLKPIFREIPISNKTYLAVPGPDDRPAVVQYPAVSPVKTEIFQFEVIPVIMNSTDSGGIRVVGQNLFVFSFIFYSFFNVFFF